MRIINIKADATGSWIRPTLYLLKIVLVVVACRVVRGVGAYGWRVDSIVDGVSGWGAAAPSMPHSD